MPSTKTKASAPPESEARAAVKVSDDKAALPTAGNGAKKQMLSLFNQAPPPPVRHVRANLGGGGGDATSLCKVQGLVTRIKDEEVEGPRGKIPKRRVDLIVTHVNPNGAQDVLRSGIEGQSFLFPSRVVDTPETAASGDANAFRGKQRELIVSPMQTMRQLSTLSASFYKESKEGGESGVMGVAVGSMVEVTGVCCNAVARGGNVSYYLNAGKLTPTHDAKLSNPELGAAVVKMVGENKMQAWSAFGCSAAMGGFFSKDSLADLNPAQKVQAQACQSMWARLVSGTADRLETMAGGKNEQIAGELMGHEQRVRAIDPARLADGSVSLFLVDKYDVNLAPIVQSGLTPADKTPAVIHMLQGTTAQQEKLPEAFTAPFIVNLEVKGKALMLDFRVAYVFDKTLAIEAFEKGDDNPVLISPGTALSMTLSMRDIAVKLGSRLVSKATTAATELLPTATFAAFPKMLPSEPGEMKSDFPGGGTICLDMPKTLAAASINVSKEFIKSVLCGGGEVRVAPTIPKDAELFDFPEKVTELPTILNDGYQELTGNSFDLGNWDELEGTLHYYVVFPDVADAVKELPELATDTGQGMEYINDMAPGGAAKVKAWMTSSALVYAVLVK